MKVRQEVFLLIKDVRLYLQVKNSLRKGMKTSTPFSVEHRTQNKED